MGRNKRQSFMESERLPQERSGELLEQVGSNWPTAIYARLSKENSGRDDGGESIAGQVEICRNYVDEHPDLRYVETYVDNGWTGTNTDRPGFQRMMNDIYSGRIKAVVIKDFSRFSRDYIEAGNLLENVFPALGVRFISVTDYYDSFETDGSANSLLIPIKNLVNSFYSKDISRKIYTSIHTRQMEGAFIPGKIPYGYRKSTTQEYRLEPDPETAANVTRIFQMRVDGIPLEQIARTLQTEGIPSPGKLRFLRGQTTDKRYETSRWYAETVKAVLRNPIYQGDLVFGRSSKVLFLGNSGSRIYEPDESKWRVLRDMHEPLVTREIFERAKAMDAAGRADYKAKLKLSEEYRHRNVSLFDGYLYCGDCGRKLYYARDTRKPERLTGWYYCANKTFGRCNSRHPVTPDCMKGIVWQALQEQFALCARLETDVEGLRNGKTTVKLEEYREGIHGLSIQLKNRRDKQEKLYDDFTDGLISQAQYMTLKNRYETECQKINGELEDLRTRLARLKKTLSGQNPWLLQIRRYADAKSFSPDMLSALVEKILLFQMEDGSKRVEIRFRYAADRELLMDVDKELGGGA